jgi:medium-chain acyl-[acyl-carrier-protein] hydrolase
MKADSIFTQKINVPYSAMGTTGQIKIDRLLNMFQDSASLQCEQLGISGFDMARKQLKWVISRYQIQIHKNPECFEPLELKTWRSPWKNLYEIRQFTILDQNKNKLVSALGVWILVKAENSKPVRLTPHLPSQFMTPIAQSPELLNNDHDILVFDHESEFKIRVHDLDLNHHVNNTVYVQWAMESVPASILFKYAPISCVVSFLKESFYPDRIISSVKINKSPDKLISMHSIFHKTDKTKLANLTMIWKKF